MGNSDDRYEQLAEAMLQQPRMKHFSLQDAQVAVEAIATAIKKQLTEDGTAELPGIGTFTVREHFWRPSSSLQKQLSRKRREDQNLDVLSACLRTTTGNSKTKLHLVTLALMAGTNEKDPSRTTLCTSEEALLATLEHNDKRTLNTWLAGLEEKRLLKRAAAENGREMYRLQPRAGNLKLPCTPTERKNRRREYWTSDIMSRLLKTILTTRTGSWRTKTAAATLGATCMVCGDENGHVQTSRDTLMTLLEYAQPKQLDETLRRLEEIGLFKKRRRWRAIEIWPTVRADEKNDDKRKKRSVKQSRTQSRKQPTDQAREQWVNQWMDKPTRSTTVV